MLLALVKSEVSRELAADWAMVRIREGAPEYADDTLVWTALDRLGGADLKTATGSYLHGQADFDSWLREMGS
ncbi:hypothetical protein ACFQ05_00460 [Amycolatopsis umgeniensis]|uniref:Uncharacterized protein n=1 Tax=Amycolatopsis umgeniensis TaxID=336628 RepID=A0A841AZ95_9PSEU|nr:hypothetical protein [Amycolatopsis umgeniensis]MBB5851725.1 hypothetical protein [Amycolatopsis umgeniensis]